MNISFLALPLELRDIIYSHLLHRPSGIFFSPAFAFSAPPDNWSSAYNLKGRDNALVKHETRRHSTKAWLPTEILYVSKQVNYEATEILYQSNNFIFAGPVQWTVDFLTALPTDKREMIRHVTILKRTMISLHSANFSGWTSFYSVLQEMKIEDVTFYPPLEPSMYKFHPAIIWLSTFGEASQFWWPALRFLAGLLMSPAHSLKRIQLIYPISSPPTPASISHIRESPELKDPKDLDIENLIAIKRSRVPRLQEDAEEEEMVFNMFHQSGPHGAYTRQQWDNFYKRPDVKARIPLGFKVKCEARSEGLGLLETAGIVLTLRCSGK